MKLRGVANPGKEGLMVTVREKCCRQGEEQVGEDGGEELKAARSRAPISKASHSPSNPLDISIFVSFGFSISLQ